MAGISGGLIEWFFDVSEPSKNLHRLAVFLHRGINDGEEFQELVKAEMYKLSHDSRSQEVDVIQFDWMDWNEQEYIGGGPVSVCRENVLASIKEDLELSAGINFAGAEYSNQFTGYVEGALRSGERTADNILGFKSRTELKAKGSNWLMFAFVGFAWLLIKLIIIALRLLEDVVRLPLEVYHRNMKVVGQSDTEKIH